MPNYATVSISDILSRIITVSVDSNASASTSLTVMPLKLGEDNVDLVTQLEFRVRDANNQRIYNRIKKEILVEVKNFFWSYCFHQYYSNYEN